MRSLVVNVGLLLAATATAEPELSPFEQFANATDYTCKHLVLRSGCSDAQLKGLVVYFHGFSACSSQISKVAARLNAQCFDVLAPTLPGHGQRPIPDCDAPNVTCTVRWNGKQGFDLRRLPTRAEPYGTFVEEVNEVVRKEREWRAKAVGKVPPELSLSAMGLSFGSALALYAVAKAPNLYSHQLLLNPSFGGGVEEIDQHLFECHAAVLQDMKTPEDCMNQEVSDWQQQFGGPSMAFLLNMLVPRRNSPGQFERDLSTRIHLLSQYWVGAPESRSVQRALAAILGRVTVWGDVCPKIFNVTPPRSGFCAFEMRHVLASSSFSLMALVEALKVHDGGEYGKFPVTQAILTERDGMTRNGLTYQLLTQLKLHNQDPLEAACMYRFRIGTNRSDPLQYWSNDNAMPHANIDQADTPGQLMWWEDSLFGRIVQFLNGNTTVSGPEAWKGTRDECPDLSFGPDAFDRQPWLREAVLPEAAPLTPEELVPDDFWTNDVLKFDVTAQAWCKDPTMQPLIAGFVDCSIFPPSTDVIAI